MRRRRLIQITAAAAGASLLPRVRFQSGRLVADVPAALAYNSSPGIQKYAKPLRGVFPLDSGGIPVAVPDPVQPAWRMPGAQHYSIDISQYQDSLTNLGPTTLWGYNPRFALGVANGPATQRYLGGIIVAQRGTPVQITFQNRLPKKHILPVDPTIMGVMGNQVNRTSVHLHGGLVPWISDGGPFSWFDNAGHYGSSVQAGSVNLFKTINPFLQSGQAEYYYPNDQSARLMWYHDHAVGITRLNAYAGIATAYIIRDLFEGSLRNLGLPDFIENGGREIPLIIQEKIFVGSDIRSQDPSWPKSLPSSPGSLWYPHVYEPDRWTLAPGGLPLDPKVPSAIPEMFGDTMLVNGIPFPRLALEPRRYRLRILNGCQARFLNLQLYVDNGAGQPNLAKAGPDFLVIGTEGGFLERPVSVPMGRRMKFIDVETVDPADPGGSLITAPAERWDVIVDFSAFAGKSLILYNDAPAPYPEGDEANDVNTPSNTGPGTRTIMRIDVASSITGSPDVPLLIDRKTPLATNPLSGIDHPLAGLWTTAPLPPPHGVKVRNLTLNEVYDEYGRLIQMLGTNAPVDLPPGYTSDTTTNCARSYDSPATETPRAGTTEVWKIANLTGDTHPMHFHLVNVQLLSRQPFDDYVDGQPTGLGKPRGPQPLELGWKETVKMNPDEVTTVIMKFTLPTVPFRVPESPRTGGYEYVWHCHILEHEEHDMMRPLIVT